MLELWLNLVENYVHPSLLYYERKLEPMVNERENYVQALVSPLAIIPIFLIPFSST
jgi:hypothetical protein